MPAFGTVTKPVRTSQRIEVNSPDGFMTEPPGDLWWVGLRSEWIKSVPPAVTRATAVLINPLCRLPWNVRRADGVLIEPGQPGYPPWLTDPALLNGTTGGPNSGRFAMLDRVDRFDFWAKWVRDALWFGIGALAFEPDSEGQPIAGTVQVLSPGQVYRGDDGWAVATRGSVEPVDDDGMILGRRVLLLRHSLAGGVFGWHRAQIDLANRMSGYAGETFESAVPSGVLSTEQQIDQTQADFARAEWNNRQASRGIAVLGNGTKYQQVTQSPVDTEIVAMVRWSNEQMAHAFELPAWYLDATQDTGTYSTSLTWRQDLVDGPLASWDARISETLGSLFPWGWRLEIDFTQYTRPTTGAAPQPATSPEV